MMLQKVKTQPQGIGEWATCEQIYLSWVEDDFTETRLVFLKAPRVLLLCPAAEPADGNNPEITA